MNFYNSKYLITFIMYSLIGDAASGMETDIDSHRMIIYTENMPTEFRNVVRVTGVDIPKLMLEYVKGLV